MIYYTVDRENKLESGMEINLQKEDKYPEGLPANLLEHTNHVFPDGLSQWGIAFWLKSYPLLSRVQPSRFKTYVADMQQMESIIEMIFEGVRQIAFKDKPSRFQCMYGCETLEEAKAFREKYGQNEFYKSESQKIYKVECNGIVHKADMEMLRANLPMVTVSHIASMYWSGQTDADPSKDEHPAWEILLPLPIKVLEAVNT
jgi:hypothetical protein